MVELKEKDIVDYIIEHMKEFFPSYTFYKREASPISSYRADIWCREFSYPYDKVIFIEVKYQNPSRDLIYEVEKAEYIKSKTKTPVEVIVISDYYDDNNYRVLNNKGVKLYSIVKGKTLKDMKIVPYQK